MRKLLVLLLLSPTLLFAQKAFDGTWLMNLESAEVKGNDKFGLNKGTYWCSTCVPKIEVKADGQDHKVADSPYFETLNIREVNDHTVEIEAKKAGNVVSVNKLIASDDGKTLATEYMFKTEGGQTGTGKYQSERVGVASQGAHLISGEWHALKLENASDSIRTVTYKASEDDLSMTDQIGDSYTAKFDGKDYPYKGDPGVTTVSLKKIDANTIEETDKLNGKVIFVSRMTVSPDGKTITNNTEDKRRGLKFKSQMEKQQ
jgi:hypothetical protein